MGPGVYHNYSYRKNEKTSVYVCVCLEEEWEWEKNKGGDNTIEEEKSTCLQHEQFFI